MIVDLFAGPGGWDQGMRLLGVKQRVLGFDTSASACATREAAGHETTRVDLLGYPPSRVKLLTVRGIVGSPPCRGFSTLGAKVGVGDLPMLVDTLTRMAHGDADAFDEAFWHLDDPRSTLVLVPMRWIVHHRPAWVALEQVPAVLPAWEAYATLLQGMGYRTAVGVLDASRFGVPQARRRAFMIASQSDAELELPAGSDEINTMANALGWPSGEALTPFVRSRVNDQSGTPYDPRWPEQRAATVVAGRLLVCHPGSNANRFNGLTKSRNDGIRVTVDEAAALQTFPADYPWHGSEAEVSQQIGDAVPPLLAAHVLGALGVGKLSNVSAAATS